MKKFSILFVTILMIFATGCGMKKVDVSSKYLVGFDYSSYADVYGMAPVIDCRVRYDKVVEADFSLIDDEGKKQTKTLEFALSDAQFNNILNGVNPVEIYNLDPKCADPDDVCDGGDVWLFVYGPDDELLKRCGGFCPRNKRFDEIRRVLFDNIPIELEETYSQYETYGSMDASGEELKENTDSDEELTDNLNRAYIAAVLNIDDDDRGVNTLVSGLKTVGAGLAQSITLGEEDSERYLDVVAENGTNYRIYMTNSYHLRDVKNLDTGDWVITSEM